MIKLKKSILIILVIAFCTSILAIQASASSTYVYGRVAGYNTTGYVSCENTKGTASTNISGTSSDGMGVFCGYTYYDLNNGQQYNVQNYNNGIAGTLTVVTHANPQSTANIRPYKSDGRHDVSKSGQSWSQYSEVYY